MEKRKTANTLVSKRNFFWEQAPEALLEKTIELNSILSKFRNLEQNTDSLAFYESVLKIMQLAYSYMSDTRHIHQRNVILEANIRFLASYNAELEQKVNEYETITRLQQENRLEEIIELSESHVEAVLSAARKIHLNGTRGKAQTP